MTYADATRCRATFGSPVHTRRMGIIRKTMSASTVGLIDFRSDKERVARSARLTRKAVKEQTRQQAAYSNAQLEAQQHQIVIAAQQAALQQAALQQAALAYVTPPQQPSPSGPPAGWYPTAQGDRMQWWDGYYWSEHYQPLALN